MSQTSETTCTKSLPVHVLLVEDNRADADFVRETLRGIPYPVDLEAVRSAEEAWEALETSPRPDVVLLDLRLPGKSGQELLAEMRADQRFGKVPVVVMTTSRDLVDVRSCYELCANLYVAKPIDAAKFIAAIHALTDHVILPPESDS